MSTSILIPFSSDPTYTLDLYMWRVGCSTWLLPGRSIAWTSAATSGRRVATGGNREKIITGTPEFLGLRSRDRQGWIKRPNVFHLPPFIWSRTRGLFGSTIFAKGNLAISRAGFARCCWYDHQAPDLGHS